MPNPLLASRVMLLWLLVVSLVAVDTHAMPTFLLDNPEGGRCFHVEASEDSMVRVRYHAIDMVFDRSSPDYSETYISISVIPFHRVVDTKLHPSPIRHRLRPTNALLEEESGQIVHIFEMDGRGEICVHNDKATAKHPLRFALRVQRDSDEESLAEEKEEMGDFSEHLSHMEMEIARIEKAMHSVLKDADYLKEQDAQFHKEAMAMDSATIFWPIVQVCVLLMTGFTQARHIVEFFKQRRII